MALDFFAKTREDYTQRTVSGAAISVISLAIICWLGLAELHECVRVETVDQIVPYGAPVEGSAAPHLPPQLSINMDIHFPGLHCSDLAVELAAHATRALPASAEKTDRGGARGAECDRPRCGPHRMLRIGSSPRLTARG